jgi:hypothetical protein
MSIKTCDKREKGGCKWKCNAGGKKKDLINKKSWMGTHPTKVQGK